MPRVETPSRPWMDLFEIGCSGRLREYDGRGRGKNPGAVSVIGYFDNATIRYYKSYEGQRLPRFLISHKGDHNRFTIYPSDSHPPRSSPPVVIAEIGGIRHLSSEGVSHLYTGIRADQFTQAIPIASIEPLHIEVEQLYKIRTYFARRRGIFRKSREFGSAAVQRGLDATDG